MQDFTIYLRRDLSELHKCVIHHIEHHGTVIGTGRHDTSQLLVEHCLAVRRTKEEGRLYTCLLYTSFAFGLACGRFRALSPTENRAHAPRFLRLSDRAGRA